MPLRRGGTRRVLHVVVIAAGLGLAGCTVDNPGPGITIHNTTNEPVVVVYHRAGTDAIDTVGTLVAGDSFREVSLFRAEGPCLRGVLTATVGQIEIDRLDRPCQGGRWDVAKGGDVHPSQSGG